MMLIDTKNLVTMTEANQNFSRIARLVDESGMAIILKNNNPRYMVVDFSEYERYQAARMQREKFIMEQADLMIEENREALKELAK